MARVKGGAGNGQGLAQDSAEAPLNYRGEYSSLTCWQPNALEGIWKK